MKKMILVFAVILIVAACKKSAAPAPVTDESSSAAGTTDFAGTDKKYPFIQIGTQKWMAANLDVGHYRNGDKIPQVRGKAAWAALTTGAWCWYNNDPANGAVYGRLYNWYAVTDPRGLAPEGWHIPSAEEWTTLSTFLGGDLEAGGKMKEEGTIHWIDPNSDATNSSGFTGLPGGVRLDNGKFFYGGMYADWWSTGEDINPDHDWGVYRYISYFNGALLQLPGSKQWGYSVRCVKD